MQRGAAQAGKVKLNPHLSQTSQRPAAQTIHTTNVTGRSFQSSEKALV
jgi:hypothetical protein